MSVLLRPTLRPYLAAGLSLVLISLYALNNWSTAPFMSASSKMSWNRQASTGPSRSASTSSQQGDQYAKVYMDIKIGDSSPQRLTIKLFNDTPKTSENFRKLIKGDGGKTSDGKFDLAYKGSKFHRIIPGFMAQGGDFTRGDGRGGESIYGRVFKDENFNHKHTKKGILSMANAGPGTNGSQYFVTFGPSPHLDGRHVVFGEVVDGMDTLSALEKVKTDAQDRPLNDVVIVDTGILEDKGA